MQSKAATAGLLAAVALFAVALAYRVVNLGHVPGVNGDEAWYGVQAEHFNEGSPVAWWTPTGMPLNPFFVGLIALELKVMPPSVEALRLPAVLCGVAAVACAYLACLRAGDRTAGLIAAALVATSPTAIGYSRFGWDACQTPLINAVVACFALRGRPFALAASILVAVLIHPTNALLVPIAAPACAAVVFGRVGADPAARRRFRFGLAAWSVAVGIAAVALKLWTARLDPSVRTFGPGDWLEPESINAFLTHYGRLISGVTIYEYIAGPVTPDVARVHDLAFWVLSAAATGFGGVQLVGRRDWPRLAWVAGLPVAMAAVYVTGGPDAIRPHFERYGMFLLVPTALTLAFLLRAACPVDVEAWASRRGRFVLAGVLLAGGASLAGFRVHYLDAIRTTGGESHVCFRTDRVEPKAQLMALIADDVARPDAAPGGGRIVAEDWWLSWPLDYLMPARVRGMEIVNLNPTVPGPIPKASDPVSELRRGSYVVGYVGGPVNAAISASFPPGVLRRWDVADYAGRNFLSLYRLSDAALARRDGSTARR